MNDKEYNAEKRRVLKMFNRWSESLGLGSWKITIQCLNGPFVWNGVVQTGIQGLCEVGWEYNRATILFDMSETAKIDDEELRDLIVHESMHVIVHEMRFDVPDEIEHEERVCSFLENIIQRVAEGARKGIL